MPKFSSLKEYILSQFLRVRNLEAAEMGCVGSEGLMSLQWRCHSGLKSSEGSTGAGGLTWKFSRMVDLSTWPLLTAWQLAPPEGVNQERKRQKLQCLLGPRLRCDKPSLVQYSFGPTYHPDPVLEGTTQGHTYQEVEVTGDYLGGLLSNKLKLHNW